MARGPILGAGGIVVRPGNEPLVAVVRLRKRTEWVLPKGKLDDGETPRIAAEREVLEETGHDVSVHEFLGTLAYELGSRTKVVHFWRMEPQSGQIHELAKDVKAVAWLPLDDAIERLSRDHEQAFLSEIGPLAVQATVRAATQPSITVPETPTTPELPVPPQPHVVPDVPVPAIRDREPGWFQRLWEWLRAEQSTSVR